MSELNIYESDGDNMYITKYLKFQYKPIKSKYEIKFYYNDTAYEGKVTGILGNSQKRFMSRFAVSDCSSPIMNDAKQKISRLMLNGQLTASNLINTIGNDTIKRIHFYCIRFMFKCFDRAIESYRRDVIDYFLEIRRINEDDEDEDKDDTIEFFLLTKIARIAIHANFECNLQLTMINQTDW